MSVLPVTSKIFVRLILNSLYKIAKENSCSVPINPGSGTDSSVNQLWSICTKSFDNHPSLETRFEFSDMSKAFDRVWYEGLIYKLKTKVVCDSLLTLF